MATIASSLVVSVFIVVWTWAIRLADESHTLISKVVLWGSIVILAVFQLVQYYLSWFGWNEPFPNIPINTGSSVIFPLSLAIFLHLYITHSKSMFLRVCHVIAATNVAAITFIYAMRSGLSTDFLPGYDLLWSDAAISKIVFGTAILFLDIMVMMWLYEPIRLAFKNHWPAITLTLLIALVIDSVLFSGIVAYYDGRLYWHVFVIQLITKQLIGVVYATCLTVCLERFAFEAVDGPAEPARRFLRLTFPILYRIYQFVGRWMKLVLTATSKSHTKRAMQIQGTETPSEVSKREAQAALEREWPSLLEKYVWTWVAVNRAGLIASEKTFELLDARLERERVEPDSYVIHRVVPGDNPFEPIFFSPEYHHLPYQPDSPDPIRRAEAQLTKAWTNLVDEKAGKWVAFNERGLVAEAETFDQLQEELDLTNHIDIVVRRVIGSANS